MKYVFTILGIIFGLLGLAATIKDITTPDQPWVVVGRLWFEWSPSSLQVTEAIISRYIDPCGLFVSLDCAPFLWHPVLATLLNWYAVPVFFVFALIFSVLGPLSQQEKEKEQGRCLGRYLIITHFKSFKKS